MARGVVYLLPAAVAHSPHPVGGLDALVSQVSSQEYHYPAIIDFIYKWKLFLQAKVQLFQHFILFFMPIIYFSSRYKVVTQSLVNCDISHSHRPPGLGPTLFKSFLQVCNPSSACQRGQTALSILFSNLHQGRGKMISRIKIFSVFTMFTLFLICVFTPPFNCPTNIPSTKIKTWKQEFYNHSEDIKFRRMSRRSRRGGQLPPAPRLAAPSMDPAARPAAPGGTPSAPATSPTPSASGTQSASVNAGESLVSDNPGLRRPASETPPQGGRASTSEDSQRGSLNNSSDRAERPDIDPEITDAPDIVTDQNNDGDLDPIAEEGDPEVTQPHHDHPGGEPPQPQPPQHDNDAETTASTVVDQSAASSDGRQLGPDDQHVGTPHPAARVNKSQPNPGSGQVSLSMSSMWDDRDLAGAGQEGGVGREKPVTLHNLTPQNLNDKGKTMTRSQTLEIKKYWLLETFMLIFKTSNLHLNEDDVLVNVTCDAALNIGEAFTKYFASPEYVHRTSLAAQASNLDVISNYGHNSTTMKYLANIARVYVVPEEEDNMLSNLVGGKNQDSSDRAKMLQHISIRLIALGLMVPSEENLLTPGEDYKHIACGLFKAMEDVLTVLRYQERVKILLRKRFESMKQKAEGRQKRLGEIGDLEEIKSFITEVEKILDRYEVDAQEGCHDLLHGWENKVHSQDTMKVFGATFDSGLSLLGLDIEYDPLNDLNDNTVFTTIQHPRTGQLGDAASAVKIWTNLTGLPKVLQNAREKFIEVESRNLREEMNGTNNTFNIDMSSLNAGENSFSLARVAGGHRRASDVGGVSSEARRARMIATLSSSRFIEPDNLEDYTRIPNWTDVGINWDGVPMENDPGLHAADPAAATRSQVPAGHQAANGGAGMARPSQPPQGAHQRAGGVTSTPAAAQPPPAPSRQTGRPPNGGTTSSPASRSQGSGTASTPTSRPPQNTATSQTGRNLTSGLSSRNITGREDTFTYGQGTVRFRDFDNVYESNETPTRLRPDWAAGAGAGLQRHNSTVNPNQADSLVSILKTRIAEANNKILHLPSTFDVLEAANPDRAMLITWTTALEAVKQTVRAVQIIQNEVDKKAIDSPKVTIQTSPSAVVQVMSSAAWLTTASELTAALAAAVESVSKQLNSTIVATSQELIKKMSEVSIDVLDPPYALIWILEMERLLAGSREIRQAAMQSVGFAKKLKSKLRGKDLEAAECLDSTAQILNQIHLTYLERGLGTSLMFERVIKHMVPPPETASKTKRHEQMISNLNLVYKFFTAVFDLAVTDQITEGIITYTARASLDQEHHARWSQRKRLYQAANNIERRQMLTGEAFDVSDTVLTVPAASALSASFVSREPLWKSQAKQAYDYVPIAQRDNKITTEELFQLWNVFNRSLVAILEQGRVDQVLHDLQIVKPARKWFPTANVTDAPGSSPASDPLPQTPVVTQPPDETPAAALTANATSAQSAKPKAPKRNCPINCGNQHPLGSVFWCPAFRAKEQQEMFRVCRDRGLCELCLQVHKGACQADLKCRHCGGKHNSLLHKTDDVTANNISINEDEDVNMSGWMNGNMEDLDESQLDCNMATLSIGDVNTINLNPALSHGESRKTFGVFDNCLAFATSVDPEAEALLKQLIANAAPKPVKLESDSWNEQTRKFYENKVNELMAKVAEKRKELASKAIDCEEHTVPAPQAPDLALTVNNTEEVKLLSEVLHTVKAFSNEVTRPNKTMSNFKQQRIPSCSSNDKEENLRLGGQNPTNLADAGMIEPQQLLKPDVLLTILADNSKLLSALNNKDNKDSQKYTNLFIEHQDIYEALCMIEVKLTEHTKARPLSFIKVDLPLPTISPEILSNLARVPDIEVRRVGKEYMIRCNALFDPAANLSLTRSDLITAMNPTMLDSDPIALNTVSGPAGIKGKYKVSLFSEGLTFNIALYPVKQISPNRGFSLFEVAVIERIFGDADVFTSLVEMSTLPAVTHILLGNELSELKIVNVGDPRTIGLNYNLFSHNLQIQYAPFAASKKFLLAGRFGIDPDIVDMKVGFPNLVIPTDQVSGALKMAAKFLKDLENPQEFMNNSSLASQRLMTAAEPTPWPRECTPPSVANNIEASVINSYKNNTEINQEDLVFKNPRTVDIPLDDSLDPNNMYMGVNMTVTECKDVTKYLASEKALLSRYLPCKVHAKVLESTYRNCPDCAARNSDDKAMSDRDRYQDLWDSITLAKDEKEDKYKIIVRSHFDRPLKYLGSLENSNIINARKDTDRMIDKAMNQNALHIIDAQFRDRLASGVSRILPTEIIQDIIDGKRYHNFVSKNYVYNLSSETSPLRLVSNTMKTLPCSGSSLVSSDFCPKTDIIQLLDITIRSFLVNCLGQGDLHRAYHALKNDIHGELMFLVMWYLNPHDKENRTPVILGTSAIDFGYASASALLRCSILKFGIEFVKMEVSKVLLRLSSYIDNFNFEARNRQELADIIVDVKQNLSKLDLNMNKLYIPKKFYYSEEFAKVRELYPEHKQNTVSMGVHWSLVDDKIAPNIRLSLHGSIRGMPRGEPLSKVKWEETQLTRRHLTRLTPGLYCPAGRHLGPAKASATILLVKVCKIVPLSHLDAPISDFDVELGNKVKEFWKKTAQTKIEPFERCSIPENNVLKWIIIDHDGSSDAASAALYCVSENEEGIKYSYITMSKCAVCPGSVPSNEIRSHTVAALLLTTFMEAIKPLVKRFKYEPKILILTDNIPSSYAMKREVKSVLSRNMRMTVLSNMATVLAILPASTEITMAWVKGTMLSSDLNSKFFMDAAERCNSQQWRQGHKLFLEPEKLKHFWFMRITKDQTEYRDLPLLIDADLEFEEVVAANPIPPGSTYTATYDHDDFKIHEFSPVRDRDPEISVANAVDIILDDEKPSQEWHHLAAACELDMLSGAHDEAGALDIMAQTYRYHVVSDPWYSYDVNMLVIDNGVDVPRVTKAAFEAGFQDIHNKNILTGEERLTPLRRDDYIHLMSSSNNIINIINKLCVWICFRHKLQKKRHMACSIKAWNILLSSDQEHFKIHQRHSEAVHSVNGFQVVHLRLNNITLPVVANDGPLLHKTLMTLHWNFQETSLTRNMHASAPIMRTKLMNSRFGLYSFGTDSVISKVVSNCPPCLRSALRKFKCKIGDRIAKTRPDLGVGVHVSADPCGPVYVKQHGSARGSTLCCYFLVICDHATGIGQIGLMGSLDHQAVILCLKTLEKRLGTEFEHIYVDKGSQLSKSLLEHKDRKWTIHQQAATFHNVIIVERYIKEVKSFLNKAFGKFSGENKAILPLTLYQVLYLTSCLEYCVNSLPYDRSSPLSPASILYKNGVLEEFAELTTEESDIPPLNKLKKHLTELQEARFNIYTKLFCKSASLSSEPTSGAPLPEVDDLVLVLNGAGEKAELARVVEVHEPGNEKNLTPDDKTEKTSERKVKIKVKSGKVKLFPVRNLRVIAPAKNPLEWKTGSMVYLSITFPQISMICFRAMNCVSVKVNRSARYFTRILDIICMRPPSLSDHEVITLYSSLLLNHTCLLSPAISLPSVVEVVSCSTHYPRVSPHTLTPQPPPSSSSWLSSPSLSCSCRPTQQKWTGGRDNILLLPSSPIGVNCCFSKGRQAGPDGRDQPEHHGYPQQQPRTREQLRQLPLDQLHAEDHTPSHLAAPDRGGRGPREHEILGHIRVRRGDPHHRGPHLRPQLVLQSERCQSRKGQEVPQELRGGSGGGPVHPLGCQQQGPQVARPGGGEPLRGAQGRREQRELDQDSSTRRPVTSAPQRNQNISSSRPASCLYSRRYRSMINRNVHSVYVFVNINWDSVTTLDIFLCLSLYVCLKYLMIPALLLALMDYNLDDIKSGATNCSRIRSSLPPYCNFTYYCSVILSHCASPPTCRGPSQAHP